MSVKITKAERDAVVISSPGGRTSGPTYRALTRKHKAGTATLEELLMLMRASGFTARAEATRAAAASARAKVRDLRTKPKQFDAVRRMVAQVMVEVGKPDTAALDITRFPGQQNNAPALAKAAERLNLLHATLGEHFKHVLAWLEGKEDLSYFENADVGLICQYSMVATPGDGPMDLPYTLAETFTTAARLAEASGLSVAIIPDFLFPLMQSRPNHILGHHTSGKFKGFLHCKRADLPDYMLIDAGGYSGWSTLSGSDLASLDLPPLEEARPLFDRLYNEVVVANVSKYSQPQMGATETPLPENYVFVALQVPTDRTQLKARFKMEQMLNIVIERFRGSEMTVVVKPHPKVNSVDHMAMLINLGEQGLIEVRYDSIHDLLAKARAVITINSGVGSEAMLHRKPIYSFGASDYDVVTHRITSAEEFTALTTPIRPAVSDEELLRFIAFYRTRYLVDRTQPGKLEEALQARLIAPILAEAQAAAKPAVKPARRPRASAGGKG